MSQSLSKVYVHLVFSTKHRQHLIQEELRSELQAYMVATFSHLNRMLKPSMPVRIIFMYCVPCLAS